MERYQLFCENIANSILGTSSVATKTKNGPQMKMKKYAYANADGSYGNLLKIDKNQLLIRKSN